MDEKTFEEFLQTRYYKALEHHRYRASLNQSYHKRLEWGLIILSGATTILIIVQSFIDWFPLKLITAVISGFTSILAGMMKTLKYQEKSSIHNKSFNDLENEYYLYKANDGSYKEVDNKEGLFIKRVIAIQDDANNSMPNMTVPQSRFSDKTRSGTL